VLRNMWIRSGTAPLRTTPVLGVCPLPFCYPATTYPRNLSRSWEAGKLAIDGSHFAHGEATGSLLVQRPFELAGHRAYRWGLQPLHAQAGRHRWFT